jgi:adenosylhomocysteine nucleosidase
VTNVIPQCDLLLLVATDSEEAALKGCATLAGIALTEQQSSLGPYYDLGYVGDHRVFAIRTRIGAFNHGGSAFTAIAFRSATSATGIIQLGMAFGIDREHQHHGDVLISASLFPYDQREVKDGGDGPFVDYSRTPRRFAHRTLLAMFEREIRRGGHSFGVEVGTLLSGGARISSSAYRDQLVSSVPAGRHVVIGGEMEGMGLLAVARADDRIWILVKGISDFAEKESTDPESRTSACRNAASFVLSAIMNDARDRRDAAPGSGAAS